MSYLPERPLCPPAARRRSILLAALLALTVAPMARAAAPGISKDGTPAGTQGTGSTVNLSYTVPSAGSNHMLVVGAALQANGDSNNCTLAATYNGVSMSAKTAKDVGSFYGKVQLFFLSIASPDNAAHNVSVTRSGGSCTSSYSISVAAISFINTSSTTGAVSSATNTNTTMTVSPASAEGDMLVSQGIVTSSASNASVTTASPYTAIYYASIPDGYNKTHAAYTYGADGGSSTPMTFTVGGTSPEWAITSFAVKTRNGSAVKVDNFAAATFVNGVQLEWRTGSEVDNLGFNVYRDDGWGRVRLNRTPIIGSALLAGSGVSLAGGGRYHFTDLFDASSGSGPTYWLEDLDLAGRRTMHGPVRPGPGPVQLPALGPPLSAASLAEPEPIVEPPASLPAVLAPGQAHAGQWRLAGASAIKIGVDRDGWYELTGEALVAAGLDPTTDPRSLALSLEGDEVPLEVRGEDDGRLDPSDVVGFHGRRINAESTDTRVYWLAPAAGVPRRLGRAPAVTTVPTAGPDRAFGTLEWRPRSIYAPAIINGDDENFFGPLVSPDAVTHTFTVPADALGAASLEIGLQGVSYLPHRVTVLAGGQAIGEVSLDERERRSVTLPLAQVAPGPLEVALRSAGAEDTTLVDFVRLSYARPLVAVEGRLALSAPAGSAVTAGGFGAGQAVRVLDLDGPQWVEVEPASAGGEVRFLVPAGAGERSLLVQAAGAHLAPRSVKGDRPSRWNERQPGGDLVVIGPAALLPAIEPLARQRQAEGWTVATVDLEDAYDEFSFGSQHPGALRALLARAREAWQHRPRAVILLGDATNDPRDHLGRGRFEAVPTRLLATHFIETASDDWFTDLDDDGVADVPVGRLPARTLAEAQALVHKLLAAPTYRSVREATAAAPLAFVAGNPDDRNDFPAASQQMQSGVTLPFRAVSIDRDLPGADRGAQLRQALAAGPALLSYAGHGSQQVWAGGLLDATTADALGDQGAGAFWLDLTCLNGFFHDALRPSLAEVLLARAQGGAFGLWASSSLTEIDGQTQMGQAFLRALVTEGATVGEAAVGAKRMTTDLDARRSWILFGDPTWRLRAFPADAPDASAPLAPDAAAPAPADAGVAVGAEAPVPASADGCGCRVGGTGSASPALLLALAALLRRRRRS